ncbi:Uncharacterised protein at_DN1449 [Pycnogonum litorale]
MERLLAIRAIRGYRTISRDSALLLSGFTPIAHRVHSLAEVHRAKLSAAFPHEGSPLSVELNIPFHDRPHLSSCFSVPVDFGGADVVDPAPPPGDSLHIYTDGSGLGEQRGAAVYAVLPASILGRQFKLHPLCSVFQCELYTILKAVEFAALSDIRDTAITVHSGSQSSIWAVHNAFNYHPLVKDVQSICKGLTDSGNMVNVAWVRGHSGCVGNEEADSLARRAAESHRPFSYHHIPLSSIRLILRARYRGVWSRAYSVSRVNLTKTIFPDLDSFSAILDYMPLSHVTTTFMTGHGPFAEYLARMRVVESGACTCLVGGAQNLHHLIFDCSYTTALRAGLKLIAAFRLRLTWPVDLATLFAHRALREELLLRLPAMYVIAQQDNVADACRPPV